MEKMRMMIVDDEERFLTTTGRLLEKKGFEVETASGGREALEKMDRKIFHVIILDVKMPGMDGLETLKEMKKRHPLVEVVMLTGHATVESAVSGMKSGATDYIMKPADIDDIIAKAEEAFQKRMKLEEKIRLAQSRKFMKSPRDILKATDQEA